MKVAPRMFWYAAKAGMLNFLWWIFNGHATVPNDVSSARTARCVRCSEFLWETTQCQVCLCMLPVKVLFSAERCPRGYWERAKWTWARFRKKK